MKVADCTMFPEIEYGEAWDEPRCQAVSLNGTRWTVEIGCACDREQMKSPLRMSWRQNRTKVLRRGPSQTTQWAQRQPERPGNLIGTC